jgi:DNA-binding NarL/FixJ family response regulator
MAIHVLLAADHAAVREGLRGLLERDGLTVVGEAPDGQAAIKLAASSQPDVAILDLTMPSLNGLDAAREIGRVSPQTKRVMLTMHDEDLYVLKALRAGVKGYVLRTRASFELTQAVREVVRGGVYLSPVISSAAVDAYRTKTGVPIDPLTGERSVLGLDGRRRERLAPDDDPLCHQLDGQSVSSGGQTYRVRVYDVHRDGPHCWLQLELIDAVQERRSVIVHASQSIEADTILKWIRRSDAPLDHTVQRVEIAEAGV